jgi:hypothetical protein
VTSVPLFGECLVGYRRWCVGPDATLWPAGTIPEAGDVHRAWEPGPNVAWCPLHGHAAPDLACTCGLHAYAAPPEQVHGFVLGAIAAWGAVCLHPSGFRAEHAQVTALVEGLGSIDADAIAARYGVPVVPLELLEAEAQRHGAPVAFEDARAAGTPESV